MLKLLFCIFLSIFPISTVFAFENNVGSNGVSGMTFTPTAIVTKGQFDFQYMNRDIGIARHDGFNFSSVFGLTDFLEVGGRLSANTWTTNQYTANAGDRDLSASGKVLLNPMFDMQDFALKAAIGTVDYGGAATFYRSDYGVVTLDSDVYQLSLGYAKAKSNVAYNTLSGLFGSVAVAIKPWYSLRMESNDKGLFTGMTLSDESLLTKLANSRGAKIYASVDSQISGSNIVGSKPIMTVGIRMPLDGTLNPIPHETFFQSLQNFVLSRDDTSPDKSIKAGSQGKNFDQMAPVEITKTVNQRPPEPTHEAQEPVVTVLKSQMHELAERLQAQGFESISVGLDHQILVVEFSDFVFDHNNLDGAGVALGLISEGANNWSTRGIQNYRLVQSKWGTPSIGYSGELECLSSWLNAENCPQTSAIRPQVRGLREWLDPTIWEVKSQESHLFKPRLRINPVQDYYVGTEYGVIDYSLGYEKTWTVPLWDGGILDYAEVSPLKSSANYSDGQIFAFTRVKKGVEHTLLHHVQRLDGGFSLRASAGQLFTGQFKGYEGELRWESLGGEFESGLTTSYWKADPNAGYVQNVGTPTSVFAKYAPTGRDWTLELDLGQYWYHDKGASILSNFWFGDTLLSLYLRRSVPPEAYWPGPLGVTFAGFSVSFPLTPRKAMDPKFFQIKGPSQFGFSLGTPVGRDNNYIVGANGIPVYIKALVDAPVSSFLATDVLDHDRVNMSYVPAHLDRIRYAYLRWVKGDNKNKN